MDKETELREDIEYQKEFKFHLIKEFKILIDAVENLNYSKRRINKMLESLGSISNNVEEQGEDYLKINIIKGEKK